MTRGPSLCPGTRICCPACGKPIPLLDIRNGDGFAVCTHKVGNYQARRPCNQAIYFHCTARLCSVFALTAEEHRRFDNGHFTPSEILARLGETLTQAA